MKKTIKWVKFHRIISSEENYVSAEEHNSGQPMTYIPI